MPQSIAWNIHMVNVILRQALSADRGLVDRHVTRHDAALSLDRSPARTGLSNKRIEFATSIIVRFTPEEQAPLLQLIRRGKAAARLLCLPVFCGRPMAVRRLRPGVTKRLVSHWRCMRPRWPACASVLSNKVWQRPCDL